MSEATEHCMYLGLSNTMGRNKNAILGFLKDRVCKRFVSWDGQIVSKAGKEILLKTVFKLFQHSNIYYECLFIAFVDVQGY